jgi:hypothetical protein
MAFEQCEIRPPLIGLGLSFAQASIAKAIDAPQRQDVLI